MWLGETGARPFLSPSHCPSLIAWVKAGYKAGRMPRRAGSRGAKQIMGHEAVGEERRPKKESFPDNWMWWSRGVLQLEKSYPQSVNSGKDMER